VSRQNEIPGTPYQHPTKKEIAMTDDLMIYTLPDIYLGADWPDRHRRYEATLKELFEEYRGDFAEMIKDGRFPKISEFPENDSFGGHGMEICLCNDSEVFISLICHVDEKPKYLTSLEFIHTLIFLNFPSATQKF
jgi:hypothetical protein